MKKIKFILIFLLGIILFFIPISLPIVGLEEQNIFIIQFMKFINLYLNNSFLMFLILLQILIIVIGLLGFYRKVEQKEFKNEFLNQVISLNIFTNLIRIVGSLLFLLIIFKNLGINIYFQKQDLFFYQVNEIIRIITNPKIGQICFNFLLNLIIIYFIGNLLLPLLNSFGMIEFLKNILMIKIKTKNEFLIYFKWVLINQLEQVKENNQKYSNLLIPTSNILFVILIVNALGLSNYFLLFYFIYFLVIIITNYIIIKMNFLNLKELILINDYNTNLTIKEAILFSDNICNDFNFKKEFKNIMKKIIITYLNMIPNIMIVGVLILTIFEKTTLLQTITMPLIPFVEFIGFAKESIDLGIMMFVGSIDTYLPILLINTENIFSTASIFFIGILTLIQFSVIRNNELKIIERSKLFLLKTIISIPIILIMIYLLVYFKVVSF